MAKLSCFILLFLFTFCFTGSLKPVSGRHHSKARSYIEASCQTTRYPAVCLRYLSAFPNSTAQNPQTLAQMALSVSLYRARHTRSYMLNLAKDLKAVKAREYPAVRDCLEQINDSVDQLSQSIKELRRLDTANVNDDFSWHISNVETWVSSALTDTSCCIDGFRGRHMSKLKATVKGKVVNVAEVTSNALALFHRYAARAMMKKKP